GHLVEFCGDDEYRHAGIPRLDDSRVHELDGSDVETTRGLRSNEQRKLTAHFARKHDLLLVTAREVAGLRADSLSTDVELTEFLFGELRERLQLNRAELDEGLALGAV